MILWLGLFAYGFGAEAIVAALRPHLASSPAEPKAHGGAGIDFDRYCVRCDSEVGHDPERPDWCSLCWNDRKPIPSRIRALLP